MGTKIELVERLGQTGLEYIEAGSFVSPKWVPQVEKLSTEHKALLIYHVDGKLLRNSQTHPQK
jgi:isopropylmalate/homocitrate/citramalate synthase